MSVLNSDLVYSIILFYPTSNFSLVCKEWNTEYKHIKKKAVSVIGNWYNKKKFKIRSKIFCKTVKELIRWYILRSSVSFFLYLPERLTYSLDINSSVLSLLSSNARCRTIRDVKGWLELCPFVFSDYLYADMSFFDV
jgi:hypothetical protein